MHFLILLRSSITANCNIRSPHLKLYFTKKVAHTYIAFLRAQTASVPLLSKL